MNSPSAREEVGVGADEAEEVVTRSKALTGVERLVDLWRRLLRPAAGVPARGVPRSQARPRRGSLRRLRRRLSAAIPVAELHAVSARGRLPALPRRDAAWAGRGRKPRGGVAGLPHRPRRPGAELQRGFRRAGRGGGTPAGRRPTAVDFSGAPAGGASGSVRRVYGCSACATRCTTTSSRSGDRKGRRRPHRPKSFWPSRGDATSSATTNSPGRPTNSCTRCSRASRWARRCVRRLGGQARSSTVCRTTLGRGFTTGLPRGSSAESNSRAEACGSTQAYGRAAHPSAPTKWLCLGPSVG